MSRFSEEYANQLERMHGNAQAAIYHVFEELLTDRGLVSEPEFFLPPNEFDIVGGVADTRRGEFALIAAVESVEGAMLDFDTIEAANEKAFRFLEGCTSYSPTPSNNLDVLHDAFVRASASVDLVPNTTLILLTPGRVGGSSKEQARTMELRTEIMDLDEFLQVSEHSLLNIMFSELGQPPQVIHARNDADDHEVFMGVVSGITLAKLYERFGIPLLDGNVRHFLGQVGPNRGIAETLEESPEHFCSYNNGITMVAEEATISGNSIVSASGASIVNGGQTTVSIFNAHRKGVDLTKVSVPIKFIHLTVSHPVGKKNLLEAISRFSNTQSKVNDADRMVNMAPHPELQEVSQKERVFSGGNGWYYERRRGEIRTKELTMGKNQFRAWSQQFRPEHVISASEIGIAWNAWWGTPHNGASGKNKGFLHYHNELTMRLARRSWDAEVHHKKTIGLAKLYYFGKDYMANEFSGLRSATLPHVLGWLSHLMDNQFDLIALWQQEELPDVVKEAFRVLAGPVDRTIRNFQDDDQKQWAKSANCTEAIRALPVPDEFPKNQLPRMSTGQDVQGDPAEFLMGIGATKLWVMYRWGKDNQVINLNRGMITGILTRTISRNRRPSPNQANVILTIWHSCIANGFDPDREYPEYSR